MGRHSMATKTIFGRYRITGELSGAGGMAILWQGEDTQTRAKVAIKQLRPELLSTADCQEMIKRFENEASMHLPSEHVVQGYQFGQDGGDYFYVMEYVPGKDLSRIIHPQHTESVDTGNPLPEEEVVDIVAQAAEGLECAHAHSIVHRDVKPANILVTSAGVAKLTDFGIACFTSKARQTQLGTQMGSPFWESPEQIDDPRFADARSDIWSLGVVMYESLTGGVPFYDTLESGLYLKIKTQDPPDLDQKAGRPVSPAVQRTVRRCLQKDPDLRFQSMAEVRAALGKGGTSTRPCAVCQAAVPADARFCPKCGYHVTGAGTGRLVVMQGPSAGQSFLLDRDVTRIGRVSESEVSCANDEFVSRRHAVVRRDRGAYCLSGGSWVGGHPSTNGTFLNGKNVDGGAPVLLHPGDCIRVGDTFLRFEIV